MEQEKLAVIGLISAGITHEIGNATSSFASGFDNLKRMIENDKLTKEKFQGIYQRSKRGLERIKSILENMSTISIAEKFDLKAVPLGKIITRSKESICEEFRQISINIENFKDFDIYCNPTSVEQILTNLIKNSAQELRSKKIEGGKIKIFVAPHKESELINIVVEDNGNGIDEKDINKIFDPFFTTKEIGDGTGFGLSLSKKMAQMNGGDLFLGSNSKGRVQFFLTVLRS